MLNFLHCFESEWLKKRRSLASWLVVVGAFFTPVIVIVVKLVRSQRLLAEAVSPNFWEALWTSCWESMAIFLLPLGIVLATSLLSQIEFKNNCWKQLHTIPQSLTTIYFAKLAVLLVMVLQFFALFNLGIYLAGVVPGLLTRGVPYPYEVIPYQHFLQLDLQYLTDCLPILGLELLVSLQFSNFLVPVGGGIVLWVLSLSVLNWQFGYLSPFSYLGLEYLRSLGKYSSGVNLQWWAAGYFAAFVGLGLILYTTKRQKG